MQIKDKVLKIEKVNWRTFKFLQTDKLKHFPPELETRLRESIIANHFVMSFRVWENKSQIYCLDGFHRCRILSQLEDRGYNVPEKLPAEFLDCKNKREAAKLVLVYSSHYTEINKGDLNSFILDHGLNVDQLSDEINVLFSKASGAGSDDRDEILSGDAEYPITPKFSEQYDYAVVFCKNSVDFAHLCETLGLDTKKSYKNTAVGISRVLTYDEFMERWKSR